MRIDRLLAVILMMSVTAAAVYSSSVIKDWYAVADWELDYCSEWGGTAEASSGATYSSTPYLSQTTLTLQGKKQGLKVEGYNRTIYTVSWYLEPITAMSYEIHLVTEEDEKYKVAEGEASINAAGYGYKAEYYDKDYSYAVMNYGTQWLKVPLIEVE